MVNLDTRRLPSPSRFDQAEVCVAKLLKGLGGLWGFHPKNADVLMYCSGQYSSNGRGRTGRLSRLKIQTCRLKAGASQLSYTLGSDSRWGTPIRSVSPRPGVTQFVIKSPLSIPRVQSGLGASNWFQSQSNALAIFGRRQKRFDHIRTDVVAVELIQLRQPEVITCIVERRFRRVVRIAA